MVSRAGKSLLARERASILSSALDSIGSMGSQWKGQSGCEPPDVLARLLDFIIDESEEDGCTDFTRLAELTGYLADRGMAFSATHEIWQALVAGIFDQLNGQSNGQEMRSISMGLLRAQGKLLEACMENEGRKRENLAQHLREIDRFPDTIAATLDPPTLTKVGLAKLKDLIRLKEATIFKIAPARKLVPMAGDLFERQGGQPVLELKAGAERILLERGDIYLEKLGDEHACCGELLRATGTTSVIMLPLMVRGRTTGVIALSHGPDRDCLKPEEMELAVRFANRLAVALENAYLHEREQRKIKETVALLEIARVINSSLDLRHILDKVVRMTVDLCGVVMCVVYLLEEEAGRFEPSAYYGFIEEGQWENESELGFTVDGLQKAQVEMLDGGAHVVLPVAEAGCLIHADLLYEHGVDLVFLFPLSSKNRLTGAFALFYPCRVKGELESEEIEVVKAIAAQASIAIENAALYEDIEKSYFSTVKALAKAIEVKDPYTHGHSERVTEYALMIADAMSMEEREKQKLKYAATLHDIGKIGIAGRVLNKPSGLTDEEYTHVKTHPMLGDSIIEPVEFLQGPRPIILHHHERFDGTGYPRGLKGSGIPLCARILSVADAFEAMRSDRPYRKALPLQTAREELKRNAGTQFDPEVVSVFLCLLESFGGDPVSR